MYTEGFIPVSMSTEVVPQEDISQCSMTKQCVTLLLHVTKPSVVKSSERRRTL